MRKNLISVGIVTLSLAAVASYAQTPVTTNVGPGSPIVGAFANWSADPATMAEFKAQNNLSPAQNALTRGLGKYKNATVPGGTIPFFESYFLTGSRNSLYTYTMVGQSPTAGGTTTIPTVLIPLPIQLNNGGTEYYYFDPGAANDLGLSDIQLIQQSPAYNSNTYPGGGGGGVLPSDTGQLVDTAQRASFHGVAAASWHTEWGTPSVNESYYVILDYASGQWACIGGEAPPCTSFPVVNINTLSAVFGDILTLLGTGVVPNTTVPMFLTDFLTAYEDNAPGDCCVLGYHTAQTGVGGSGILVWGWGTYLTHNPSNGFSNPFGGFTDMSVWAHETSELVNDPFVNTNVAPWVDGSVSFCQGNLETGDVIEAMAAGDAVYPMNVSTSGGTYTYHPQNTGLLDWFTRNPYSDTATGAAAGTYSWPNTNTLNQAQHGPSLAYGMGSAYFCFGAN